MKKSTKIIAAISSTAVLAGGVTAGLAYAETPSPTPTTPSASASPGQPNEPTKDRVRRGLMKRALHGEVTLAGKQHRTVAFQRGTITAVNAGSVTVRSTDGFSATYRLETKTRVRQGKEPGTVTDLAAEDTVRVVARKDGSTLTAKVVRERVK